MLAEWCDYLLKVRIKGLREIKIEKNLDNVMILLKCLHDSDIFLKVYTEGFASRLLNKESLSIDAEKLLILKIQEQLGFISTLKLNRMIEDVELSKSMMDDYKKSSKERESKYSEFNINILTS